METFNSRAWIFRSQCSPQQVTLTSSESRQRLCHFEALLLKQNDSEGFFERTLK
jgi:hypothetical protein